MSTHYLVFYLYFQFYKPSLRPLERQAICMSHIFFHHFEGIIELYPQKKIDKVYKKSPQRLLLHVHLTLAIGIIKLSQAHPSIDHEGLFLEGLQSVSKHTNRGFLHHELFGLFVSYISHLKHHAKKLFRSGDLHQDASIVNITIFTISTETFYLARILYVDLKPGPGKLVPQAVLDYKTRFCPLLKGTDQVLGIKVAVREYRKGSLSHSIGCFHDLLDEIPDTLAVGRGAPRRQSGPYHPTVPGESKDRGKPKATVILHPRPSFLDGNIHPWPAVLSRYRAGPLPELDRAPWQTLKDDPSHGQALESLLEDLYEERPPQLQRFPEQSTIPENLHMIEGVPTLIQEPTKSSPHLICLRRLQGAFAAEQTMIESVEAHAREPPSNLSKLIL